MTALVLEGETGRAAEYLAALERKPDSNPHWQTTIQGLREFLDRDIAAVCTEYHAKEEQAAKALKLGDHWEPSPFPAELPSTERQSSCSEVEFATAPWLPKPSGLVNSVPDRTGEVQFGAIAHARGDSHVLLGGLTREEAEQKHQNREHYASAMRLPGNQLLLLTHRSGWSPHEPDRSKNPDHLPCWNYYFWIHGSSAMSLMTLDETFRDRGILRMSTISVRNRDNREIWHAYNFFEPGEKSIDDRRHQDARKGEKRPLTDDDMSLCRFKLPSFAEMEQDLLRRMTTYLMNEGFGPLPR
jgi:hypothetical protein